MESRKVKLQIALDFYTLEEAAACAQKLVDVIDILEVGTPSSWAKGCMQLGPCGSWTGKSPWSPTLKLWTEVTAQQS